MRSKRTRFNREFCRSFVVVVVETDIQMCVVVDSYLTLYVDEIITKSSHLSKRGKKMVRTHMNFLVRPVILDNLATQQRHAWISTTSERTVQLGY